MPSFILALEVSYSGKLLREHKPEVNLSCLGIERTLEKKLNTAASIRNTAKGEALRRLHKLQHDREYQALQAEYASRKKQDPDANVSDLSESYQKCMNRYGYSEYSLHQYVLLAKYQYHNILGADECQKLASQAFQSVEKIRKGEAKRIILQPRTADTSVEGKSSRSTLKYIGDCCIQFGKGNIYPLILKRNDTYAAEALLRPVKYVRIVRRTIRGKQRYFAQLVMDGIPPRTKNLYYGSSNSCVGLDEGTTTLAVVSESEVSLLELAPKTSADEKELSRLNRAIDRSKRSINPDNYNTNGTIKRGGHKWNKSNRCQKLEAKRKELYRKSACRRLNSQNQAANHIVSLGQDIRVEDMNISALSKRSLKTSVNQTNGRIHSKKRYGKVILNRTPAYLISAVDRKLSYIGRSVNRINTFKVKASQYDHISDCYRKKALSERWHIFADGTRIQRDLYSAFLIAHTTDDLKSIDRNLCERDYRVFKQLHDHEISRLKEIHNPVLCWYIR